MPSSLSSTSNDTRHTHTQNAPILVSRSTPKSTSLSKMGPSSTFRGLAGTAAAAAAAAASPSSPSALPASSVASFSASFGARLGYPKVTRWMLMTGRPRGSGTGRWKEKDESSSGGSTTSSFSSALIRDCTSAARLAL